MKLGEVYFWETNQVAGREKLLKANYNFLSYDSFVASNSAPTYSDQELATAKPALVGTLSAADLKGLRDALIEAETMETRDLNRVCKALAAVL